MAGKSPKSMEVLIGKLKSGKLKSLISGNSMEVSGWENDFCGPFSGMPCLMTPEGIAYHERYASTVKSLGSKHLGVSC